MSDNAWLDRVAHDLRGPLMPLQTAAYLLRSEASGNERLRELADIVDRQSQRLARMLEELSDWSRALQQRLIAGRDRARVGLLVDLAIGALPAAAAQPDVAGDVDVEVDGDPQRLTQLFAILLAHAQARDPGRPASVEVSRADGRVRVVVRDLGAAADAGQLLSRPQPVPFDEGLGLRLMLARAIAEAHGGRLDVELAQPDGLAIACELPAA